MLFVEHREDRFAHLQSVLQTELPAAIQSGNVSSATPLLGDCDEVLSAILDQHEKERIGFGPALAFLDQFGYGAVSMKLIARILQFPVCEVFTYLDYKDMNRWITDPNKASTFTRAYGGDEWRECTNLPEAQRRLRFLELYKEALRTRGGAKYVVSFLMFDTDDQPLYWLFFCTNNIRGLEEMKRAMWAVDGSGGFKFSDHDDPRQLPLLKDAFDQDWLADELRQRLAGRRITVSGVKDFVLVETPCYLFRGALKKLELARDVRVAAAPEGRKAGEYPDYLLDEIVLQFPAASSLF